jgi:hypothetical protein
MKNLISITEPMSLTELAVKGSYQVVITDKKNDPKGMGSGCLSYYRERLFFLTVAHVTNKENTSVTIETNKPPQNGMSENYCVGGMNYYDLYDSDKLEEIKSQNDFEDSIIESIETLDFAFAEIPEFPLIIQKEIDFKHHGVVPQGTKIVIPENGLESPPHSERQLLFYGSINGGYENGILQRQPKLTVDCVYLGEQDRFYKLKLPQTIGDASEYEGTSGAPVFDTTGNFIGLISYGFEGLPFMFIFKNTEIKKLLDYYIEANPI